MMTNCFWPRIALGWEVVHKHTYTLCTMSSFTGIPTPSVLCHLVNQAASYWSSVPYPLNFQEFGVHGPLASACDPPEIRYTGHVNVDSSEKQSYQSMQGIAALQPD